MDEVSAALLWRHDAGCGYLPDFSGHTVGHPYELMGRFAHHFRQVPEGVGSAAGRFAWVCALWQRSRGHCTNFGFGAVHRRSVRRSRCAAAAQNIGTPELQYKKVTSLADLESQLRAAEGRYVVLDFWADWCISCKEMGRFTFTDGQVKKRLEGVVLLKADVTANNADDQALLKRFGLFGPPGIIFFDRRGAEIDFQVIGFQAPKKFLRFLDSAMPDQ
ncbi:thioredoxin fold domain-containing protein [Alcaligenes faecalis]|uniref:thioredoxin fold domain-containing protein n=1 Tax=Alcaligenes faecalis TaxID=511 RepID=UPI0024BC842F|nr:thioredoxin fold domain-containing protein [Alcaligenes faecalis]